MFSILWKHVIMVWIEYNAYKIIILTFIKHCNQCLLNIVRILFFGDIFFNMTYFEIDSLNIHNSIIQQILSNKKLIIF